MQRREIVDVGRRIYQRGFVAANDGNISVRLDEHRILITPTGVSKGFMAPEMIGICDMNGNPITSDFKPSSEIIMHLNVYARRPDVHAIVHAHPPFTTAFGVAGVPLTQAVLPEVILTLARAPIVEYGTPGTKELSEPLLKYIEHHDAFILQNHGALTLGTDLTAAWFRMETLEHFATISFIAFMLGKVHTLNPREVTTLLNMRKPGGAAGDFQPAGCSNGDKPDCAILDESGTVVSRITQELTASPSSDAVRPLDYDRVRSIVAHIVEQTL